MAKRANPDDQNSRDRRVYYRRYYPAEALWGLVEETGSPEQREVAFFFPGGKVWRYRTFSGPRDLTRALRDSTPDKFDLGAVYRGELGRKKPIVARELVVDIDINDYVRKNDEGEEVDIRNCCSGSDFCSQCWQLIDLAITIVTRVLREAFGFHRLIWVFSGGRGVHCWICDKAAIHLDDPSRQAVASYLAKRRPYPELDEAFSSFQFLNTLDPLDLCPRIDMPVTAQTNHLLKAPFCAHPRTGYICVPFEQPFRPSDAPTVSQVIGSNGEVLDPWLRVWHGFLEGMKDTEPYKDPLFITDEDIPKQPFDASKVF